MSLVKKPQNKTIELAMLAFSAWGVASSTRQIATSWHDDDKLERTANVVGLVSAALGFLVSLRQYRRGVTS